VDHTLKSLSSADNSSYTDYVFGVVGTSILPILDALSDEYGKNMHDEPYRLDVCVCANEHGRPLGQETEVLVKLGIIEMGVTPQTS
jgi:hypothetical protein